jgi:putative ABC transport system substrate-binding protein
MRRRAVIAGMGAAAISSLPGRLLGEERLRRIAALIGASGTRVAGLEDELTKLGWKIGQTLEIEYRFSGGDTGVTRDQARELLARNPEVMFVQTNTAMAAVYAEHISSPTVFAMVSDPVGMHYVDSYPHPGRNIAGFTPFEPSLGAKWLSTLKEIAPDIEHIGLVYNPEPGNNAAAFRKAIDEVAAQLKNRLDRKSLGRQSRHRAPDKGSRP